MNLPLEKKRGVESTFESFLADFLPLECREFERTCDGLADFLEAHGSNEENKRCVERIHKSLQNFRFYIPNERTREL